MRHEAYGTPADMYRRVRARGRARGSRDWGPHATRLSRASGPPRRSYGVMLVELLSGRRPYAQAGLKPAQIGLAVARGDLRPELPDCSAALEKLCERAIAFKAADRHASFMPIVLALREARARASAPGAAATRSVSVTTRATLLVRRTCRARRRG